MRRFAEAAHGRRRNSARFWRWWVFSRWIGQLGLQLVRVVFDEAELLTIEILPDDQHKGIARGLMVDWLTETQQRGATLAHLEVAADNLPSLRLYEGM